MEETLDPSATLSAIMRERGILVSCEPIASRSVPCAWGDDGNTHRLRRPVHFRVTLSNGTGDSVSFEYSTGSAHPLLWAGRLADDPAALRAAFPIMGERPSIADLRRISAYGHRMTLHTAAIIEQVRERFRPDPVDMFGCVVMDLDAWEPDCSFRDWAGHMIEDCGMEWPNPADALDSFEKTRELARFLVPALGEALERAQEAAREL